MASITLNILIDSEELIFMIGQLNRMNLECAIIDLKRQNKLK